MARAIVLFSLAFESLYLVAWHLYQTACSPDITVIDMAVHFSLKLEFYEVQWH